MKLKWLTFTVTEHCLSPSHFLPEPPALTALRPAYRESGSESPQDPRATLGGRHPRSDDNGGDVGYLMVYLGGSRDDINIGNMHENVEWSVVINSQLAQLFRVETWARQGCLLSITYPVQCVRGVRQGRYEELMQELYKICWLHTTLLSTAFERLQLSTGELVAYWVYNFPVYNERSIWPLLLSQVIHCHYLTDMVDNTPPQKKNILFIHRKRAWSSNTVSPDPLN